MTSILLNEDGDITINQLKRYRRIVGKSIQQCAEELKMTEDSYRKIERGDREPSMRYAGRFIATFRQPLENLFPIYFTNVSVDDIDLEDA